ncbi:MAG: 2-oxoacid:acceptor oxidoreductase family protein [Thermodesulfobacteriota bacterium]
MLEIQFTGRGGQGVVLASQMLGRAFFEAGFYPQCYSVFGGERRGAPLVSYLRVDTKQIRLKCEIEQPNELICLDAGLIKAKEFKGLVRPQGAILLNTKKSLDSFPEVEGFHLGVVDAAGIALKCGLGRIFNTPVLGAYASFSGRLSIAELFKGIEPLIPGNIEANRLAVQTAFERVTFRE